MMLGVIVCRGKTVEDAILKAAKKLKVSREDVQFEIIDEGYRGLLWTRHVVIQATAKKYETFGEATISVPDNSLVSTNQDSEGIVWVKNGQVFCKDGTYSYALLSPCEGLTLRVNGEIITGISTVTEEDVISIDLHHEMIEPECSIEISEDKMQAVLKTVPGYEITRTLKDISPCKELVLEVITTRTPKTEIKEEDIYQQLKQLGITFGINHSEVQRACNVQVPSSIVIAEGSKPIPGKDGTFEMLYKKRQEEKDQFDISDFIDWKERFSLPSIKAGEVIGRPLPAKPGVNGKTIFGEEVPAPEAKELTVLASNGTILHGVDQKIVAVSSGRIKVDRSSNNTLCFSILPQHVHNGNVNIRTGNIRFLGDVYILGNIEEGMFVEAGGNLHITGNVSNATIHTGGDVVISGSVIGSTVICGFSNLFWDQMLPKFKAIRQDLLKLIGAAKQLEANRSFSKTDIGKQGLQPLLKILTEVKFKALPLQIREVSTFVNNDKESFDADTLQVIHFLEKAFLYYHPLITKIEQLESVVLYMESVISNIEFNTNKKMNIQVQSLTNSSIKSAWDVVIERSCYGSEIDCKGSIKAGIIRGGRVQAGNSVEAVEIGSKGGSDTVVWIVSTEGYVRGDIVWADTIVKISNVSKKLLQPEVSCNITINNLIF